MLSSNNLLLLILIIFLFYLLTKLNENMINTDLWIEYRLGDIIKGYFIDTNDKKYLYNLKKKLPNSIGGQYIKNTEGLKNKKNNYEILIKIIDSKIKLENINLPRENDIILHLRMGDVIKNYNTKTNEFEFNNRWKYVTRFDNLEKEIDKLDNSKKIIIVYGFHKKNINKKANDKYLNNIKDILKSKNFNYEEKLSGNPDEDFIFMCKAKIFIKSGGSFSRLISNMVKKNGGMVFDPIH